MNDLPQDAWFYSREGERIGPVSFSELRIKAQEGLLNPRLDMAWTQGMGEWKPAGEIEGLFERRVIVEAPSDPPSGGSPYASPHPDSVEDHMAKQDGWPGARRRTFLFTIFVLPFLLNFGVATVTVMLEGQFGKELAGYIILGLSLLLLIVTLHVSIQRFANLGMSRWWILGNFVPILNIWLGYRTIACPAGYAYHKKLDGIGIFLAIIYWLLVLLSVLAIIGFALLAAGAAGSPEMQEKLREILQSAPVAEQ